MTQFNTPNNANLYVGAGDVWFDRFDANGNPTGLRHLGNVDSMEITTTVDTKDKKSAMDGARGVYKQIVTGSKADVVLQLSEFDPNNLALAFLGTSAALLQTANPTITVGQINKGQAITPGLSYDLGFLNPTVTDVKQGATTLVLNTDYTVDAESGMITILSTGAATAAVTTWDGSCPAIIATANRFIIQGITGQIKGRLRFKSAANQASGPRLLVDVWNLILNPDGALKLISEDIGEFNLKGESQQDLTKPVGQRYFQAVTL